MNSKVFFLFLFSISLIYSFSISMTALPTNITFGNTYNTTFSINALGPITTNFYLTLTGVNASNEINVSMDEANCSYNSSVWACVGYSKPAAGSYQTKIYIHLNEMLDPSGNYSWQMDYYATENIPATQTTTSYSSNGGGSFAPRSQYIPPKNTTKPTTPPTAQNATTPISTPPKPTIEPTAQNETQNDSGYVVNLTINKSLPPPPQIIQPIEITTPEPITPQEDYSWIIIIIIVVVIGLGIFGVLVMSIKTKRKEGEA